MPVTARRREPGNAKWIEWVQAIPGVPAAGGVNPATWVLQATTLAVEQQLGVDFADVYCASELYRQLHKHS